uniref:Semaphorin-1A n=1 Tax=Cynoglossus semilaevis TaxID=244447 RepID=A0A3P8W5Z6_CYNSE
TGAMYLLICLGIFWFFPLTLALEEDSPLDCVPRKSVNPHLFHEEGVFNYSTMLLREDLDLLVLGAREAVYALDLKDISKKHASVKWEVTEKQKTECQNKGKDPELDCKNYIRILHKMDDDRMYVCGTNAFDPECDYMSYSNGKLTLENKAQDGKGKCPFDPEQRYASIMDGNLYSATSMNFLGSEPVLMRSSPVSIRTEFKSSWLNEPSFVSMAQMPESENNEAGDDDKVYLFFSEKAVECDCFNKIVVSRVARVCKGDLGGQRTLQKKWTSFLKARLDCPVLEAQLPYIIQDTYLWCDPQQHWKNCIFYAIFTPQSDTSDLSAVCAYRVSDISRVFAEGKYKTPIHVETSFVKWVMYSGDVPFPRPGACINNEARNAGITQTLDLPDKTLQFVKDSPLMDPAIQPIGEKPLLVRRRVTFTRIAVDRMQAADGEKYHVMFIGTAEGTMLKAVNYDGEMFIVEEMELFQQQEPVKILKFSNVTRELYAGSNSGAAQIPLANCARSSTCMDCVLARDPYCGWDKVVGKCVALLDSQRELIQSVKDGNASLCPKAGKKYVHHTIQPSNLASTSWEWDNRLLIPSDRLQWLKDGLLILNASHSDGGLYRCLSVEHSKAGKYTNTVAEYQLKIGTGSGRDGQIVFPQAQKDGPSVTGLQVVVALLVISLVALLVWNFYKGHLPLPWKCGKKNSRKSPEYEEEMGVNCSERPTPAEDKLLSPAPDSSSSNNNHRGGEAGEENDPPDVNQHSLQYIDDESEI